MQISPARLPAWDGVLALFETLRDSEIRVVHRA